MIDLEWLIEKEIEQTSSAKHRLGDNYFLTIDLLKEMQCIVSFNRNNEIAYHFETQIIADFHLAVLNIFRRHCTVASLILRHAIESTFLFAYSLEKINEESFKIKRNDKGLIIKFDGKALKRAYPFIEKKYPKFSKELESIKEVINALYSHANIYSAQNNSAVENERLQSLMFDNFFELYYREMLININYLICLILRFHIQLQKDYNSFIFKDNFIDSFEILNKRMEKLLVDFFEDHPIDEESVPDIIKQIVDKMNDKYS